MPYKINVAIILGIMVLVSCKSMHHSTSDLQHNWGETERGTHLLNCQEEDSFDPLFQSYIHKHITRIADANQGAFKDQLRADKFCVMPIDASEIDAGASNDGTLVINTGLLRVTDSDAQFAAAVAHELAHVTLNHGGLTFTEFVILHPGYKPQADQLAIEEASVASEKADLEASIYAALSSEKAMAMTALLEAENDVFKKQFNAVASSGVTAIFKGCDVLTLLESGAIKDEKFTKALANLNAQISPTEQAESAKLETRFCSFAGRSIELDYRKRSLLSNWTETEADEVGLEFYLRAGYAPQEFALMFQNIDHLTTAAPGTCIRGEGNHPHDCWRAQNALNELVVHEAEVKKVVSTQTAVSVFDDNLKQLIQRYRTTK